VYEHLVKYWRAAQCALHTISLDKVIINLCTYQKTTYREDIYCKQVLVCACSVNGDVLMVVTTTCSVNGGVLMMVTRAWQFSADGGDKNVQCEWRCVDGENIDIIVTVHVM
jgi:hypothetical protein